MHQLFDFGAVGSVSDAQLLDRFVSRRGEVAEAAFEALVIRHGPMVLRVCRSVLHNAHDAEDAFQAVFLVLANRAGSIRRRGSVASWLFGVALRVATRVKRAGARRRAVNQRVAERAAESDLEVENDLDWELLHDEIQNLPERLRAPIVLCYLQGLTYDAAAHRLGLSDVAIRGRLARARERLRQRLIRRGVAVPAGLLVAGGVGQVEAAISPTLIHSTLRIALGFTAGNTAAVLAREVLNSMLLNQLKVAAVLLCLGLGGSYWSWHALAATGDDQAQPDAGPGVVKAPVSAPKSQAPQPSVVAQVTGSVRVEGTGEPVQGGLVTVILGDITASSHPDRSRSATSGKNGQFVVDLPLGQARTARFQAPIGYWVPGNKKMDEIFVLSRSQPVRRNDYVVRRGSVWPFRLVGIDEKPVLGSIQTATADAHFWVEADETGRADVTLPTEGNKLTVTASTDRMRSRRFPALPIAIPLEWASGFRPEAVKTFERIEGGYRLKDDAGRIATIGDALRELPVGAGQSIKLGELGRVEPTLVNGKLVIRAVFSEAGRRVSVGSLSGRIIDEAGKPIEGVRVSPAFHIRVGKSGGGVFPDDNEQTAVTDRDGRFLLCAIPRRHASGSLTSLSLVVRKDGFASLETSEFSFRPGEGDTPHVLDPIRLEPAVSLSGTVVDADGQPVEGVWVEPSGGFALRSLFTRTDASGKFTVHNLPKGLVELAFQYGSLAKSGKYLADGKGEDLKIQLRPSDENLAGRTAVAIPEPPALGRPAPPLQVVGWTDGKSRSLADYRGKLIFLGFWDIQDEFCVKVMPNLEHLQQKFEPRGVVFLSIHRPGESIGTIRRFLELKKATMISAVDEGRGENENSYYGVTAVRYGVRPFPTLVMIDRQGNVAFHSRIGTKENVAAMKKLGQEMGLEEATMTQADFHRLWEAFFGREIEKVLNRP